MRALVSLIVAGALSSPALSAVVSPLQRRAVAGQGWSLQSSTCPSDTQSCGNGSCCPPTSHCQATGNGEVTACCPTTSNCRGSVEGAPTCASPAWSLWTGSFGNGFCCEVGLTGAFVNGGSVAGICVTSVPSGYSTASLVSKGTGSSVTSVPASRTTTSSAQTTTGSTSTKSTVSSGPTSTTVPRAVFAHYMVGSITSDEAVKDVKDAKAVGFDAFALNTHDITSSWALNALQYLFDAADQNGFKLFISFDMSWRTITPSQIPSFLLNYISRPSYYTIAGRPFVSTYDGGFIANSDWESGFQQPLVSQGINPYFVPNFGDWSGWPNNFFASYPSVDGVFSWESAWPDPGTTISNVSDAVDQNLAQQARAAHKIFMMPVSSFQFKYLGPGQDWYRIGEVNLPQRFEQVLALEPDLVELITWNDAGEGHYVGNFFAEQIAGSTIGDYANGFDHTGWQQLVTPFIKAYKSGTATSDSQILPPGSAPVGSLWYRTLMKSASCSSSIQNYQQGQDTVNYAVILPSDGYTIKVYSNNKLIGSFAGSTGLHYGAVPGLSVGGGQYIQVVNSAGSVVASATGTKQVAEQSSNATCNWNYEVVGLS
ncbi:Glucan endo-1,3-alpha-glucosidase agn1 [Trichoderma ghanense]|uniref:Glucan endo-1,3-alpha-glucosidase agn1 n=1 Tax=Trichoderma ghanense TaxID=65468 RepID=A0ABY2H447_9HYPO